MKKLILSLILIPFAGEAGLNSFHASSTVLVEARSGEWPITLEKAIEQSRSPYFLQFRDEQVLTGVLLDTLPFTNMEQLKYFEQALSVLKNGSNGDIAKFTDYSIKKTKSKADGTWYILRYKWGLTNFQQREADTLISTIKKL
ncbi:MAG TPA: hypothetical protein VKT28_15800 [Puia sp.]|nr:hypothetical protein [Puia sp.]